MPVSEDELDSRIHSSISQNNEYRFSSLSKAEQRKNNKPIMEKRRRARINQCLNELKALILDATNKDPARHTKLEKADILEMTVKHLQSIQRQHLSAAVASDPTVVHKFKTGFNECATEVSRYIGGLEGIDDGVKKRLVSHLSTCIGGIQPVSFPAAPNPFAAPHELRVSNSEDLNNNDSSRFQNVPGLQLIPSRLPSGELALLLPNSSSLSSLFPSTLDSSSSGRSRTSAFTPVSKDAKPICGEDSDVKYESSHSEVSSTSNDGTSFKTPHTPSKPQSNFSSGSSLLIPVTELNQRFKQEPYGGAVSSRSVFKPLTVFTDLAYDSSSPSRGSPKARKSPLDFSIKKKVDETPSSTSRLPKKRPLEDLPCNVQVPVKTLKLNADVRDSSRACDLANDLSMASDSASNADMWRPW